jgi:hypothetical protein
VSDLCSKIEHTRGVQTIHHRCVLFDPRIFLYYCD